MMKRDLSALAAAGCGVETDRSLEGDYDGIVRSMQHRCLNREKVLFVLLCQQHGWNITWGTDVKRLYSGTVALIVQRGPDFRA